MKATDKITVEFNIGDKVVCVCKDEDNWYKVGSEFTIRSNSFIDYEDDTVCYRVEEFSDNNIWIQADHFNLVKEEHKQMKPTDKITVEITLAELAKVYAVMGKCNGETNSSLFALAGKVLDPKNKRRGFMDNIKPADVVYYHRYEKEFLKLMFLEPAKKSKEQIKIEELQATIDRACQEIKELREMGENK